MTKNISIMGIKGIPLIKSGDSVSKIILDALKRSNLTLKDGDIILIAQTIISKSIGRILNLNNIKPSERAQKLYQKITPKAEEYGIPVKSPELIQAILDESKEIVKSEHVLITETKQGYVCANAGIDKSNIEGDFNVALLPEDSDLQADKIRKTLEELTKRKIAIIITDSFGRPFRIGAIGVALGVSGIEPILDKRGEKDLFGHKLQSTIVGQVDNLASAAQLVMGESNEGLPVVIVRGYSFRRKKNVAIFPILRKKESDLFRSNTSSKELIEMLKNRRSYKLKFDTNKSIDIKIIEECIELSSWAPSAHNRQHWRYIILDKSGVRETLIANMNKKLREDLIKDGKSPEFIQNKINKTNLNFSEAPYLILSCLDETCLDKYLEIERAQSEFIMGVQSVSASATYLLLAFELKGLSACWYCAPLFVKDIIKKELNLPEAFIPMAFYTVGYPLMEQKAPARKKLEKFIFNIE